MTYSDTTSKSGLLQDCEQLLELGDGFITGNATLKAQFTAGLNQAMYNEVIPAILESQAGWVWDDSNYTDFPRGVGNLVADQQDYQLPVAVGGANQETFLELTDVAVLDSAGNEVTLDPTNVDNATLNTQYSVSGLPRFYKVNGKNIQMWPSPSASAATLSSGLVVYYQRTQDEFTTSDTTQQPGFASPFHRLLSIIASLDYAGVHKGMEHKVSYLLAKKTDLLLKLRGFYGKRNQEAKLGLDTPKLINFK